MKPFTHYLRVRYSECDAQEVVFNARYAEYIDIASTEYMRVIWGGYEELLKQGLDSRVVSLRLDWQSPAHFDEVIAIEVQTAMIGTTSFAFESRFYEPIKMREIATANTTYVMINLNTKSKSSIPPEQRTALEVGAPGQISNHAGIEL